MVKVKKYIKTKFSQRIKFCGNDCLNLGQLKKYICSILGLFSSERGSDTYLTLM